jgi:2-amino-4-hydroxy-6-hydroxymethyldihydropteridine diphosphokinase/dihydropteroate synthase
LFCDHSASTYIKFLIGGQTDLYAPRLIPHETLPEKLDRRTFQVHLHHLVQSSQLKSAHGNTHSSQTMSPQVPLCPSLTTLAPLLPNRETHVMSILNLTPDSFSDGGRHSKDLDSLRATISSHLVAGATIIDIGGQSSRPGAKSITSAEELSRILPAIKLIKDIETEQASITTLSQATDADIQSFESYVAHERIPEELSNTLSKGGKNSNANSCNAAISIDTYRADVAKVAIEAGADIINDISAGTLDPEMLPTVAKLGCTYILMHMRGTPETMTQPEFTKYNGDLIKVIGNELVSRVEAAELAGIRRWRMILDPGIGFAKTKDQNLEILRRFNELREFEGLHGIPWLVGVSRKKFIGTITGVQEARQRTWGTAAAVTAAVQSGADIVRVHDVEEMGKVVKMADAIWRVRD